MAAELIQLRIGRIVGIHAEDELVVLPFPQILALSIGMGTIVAVDRGTFAIAFVRDHALGEFRNDAAIDGPLVLRLVVDHVHEAVVAFPGDVVRRLPERRARTRPADAVGRGDDVCAAAVILNDRQGDKLLARIPGVRMLVHRPEKRLLALGRHGLAWFNESLASLGTRGVRPGNQVAGKKILWSRRPAILIRPRSGLSQWMPSVEVKYSMYAACPSSQADSQSLPVRAHILKSLSSLSYIVV